MTDLAGVLRLGDHLGSDLDPGLEEALLEVCGWDLEESGSLLDEDGVLYFATFVSLVLLEVDVTEDQARGHEFQDGVLLLLTEVEDQHGFLVLLPEFHIVLRGHVHVSVGQELVVVLVGIHQQGS